MYCPSCGTLNDDNNFRCMQCGTVLQQGFAPAGGQMGPPNQAYGGYGQVYAESSQAATALILAAVAWAMCGIFMSIPALIMAQNELKGIRNGMRDPSKQGTAKAAFWLAAVNIGLTAVVIMFYIVIFAFVGVQGF